MKKKGLLQLTRYTNINTLLESQYGKVKYLDWLNLEMKRCKTKMPDREMEIRKTPHGNQTWAALFGTDLCDVITEG